MSRTVPLFPLGTVLFPGSTLPLHVFEPRYRAMVRDLAELPADRQEFGVVAIRKGREVGVDGVTTLHEVGCVARVRRLRPVGDGRFDLLTVGTTRFRLGALDSGGEYVRAQIEPLPEALGDADRVGGLADAVRAAFVAYVEVLAEMLGGDAGQADLPADAMALSYLVAATARIDLADRQRLLEARSGEERLEAELRLLRREAALLRALPSAPAPELSRTPISPN